MLKAINSSRSIKKTSNNKKNVVVSSVTRKEAFQGRVGKNLPDRLCLKTRLGNKMSYNFTNCG